MDTLVIETYEQFHKIQDDAVERVFINMAIEDLVNTRNRFRLMAGGRLGWDKRMADLATEALFLMGYREPEETK